MTIIAACNSSIARVNATRSTTPDSTRKSDVAISHSLRSILSTARALRLSRFASSRRRTPHSAWKCGTMREAMNVALPRASFA